MKKTLKWAKSIFLAKEGANPKNKVLDFLIIAQDFDYSLKDLAKYSGISYPCMKQLKKDLVKNKWIILTRAVGKAQMYKLNINNKKVSSFIDFYWSVVDSETESSQPSAHVTTGSAAMPMSAKNF